MPPFFTIIIAERNPVFNDYFQKSEPAPEQIQQKSAENCGGNIDKDSCGIPTMAGNGREDFLAHLIVGADIEHIDVAAGVEQNIEHCRCEAEKQVAEDAGQELPGSVLCISAFDQTGIDSEDDQENMPEERVERQGSIRVIHAAGVKKCEDASEKGKSHEKSQTYPLHPFAHPGEGKT